ncbi:MAG: HlyD family type I secretion periplasmic adaptor subunit [Acetobacteraceae bacterium]|nr:HlyD family type I secretion periplasmic adaptor subunit [Acetobacteraceae bacterium]
MPRSPQTSSTAISTPIGTALADRRDLALPVILEYQSPSTAIVNTPMPRIARGIATTVSTMVIACFIAMGVIKVDKVVTAQGRVIAKSPTMVVQPLETAIVRSIEVREGETVRAGQILARLDPTFAAADLEALKSQVAAYSSQTARLQAEMENRPFAYSGSDPHLALEAAIYAQRQAEYNFKLEGYRQKAESLSAQVARSRSDVVGYRDRLNVATNLEKMRMELDRLGVGSKINTLSAMDTRAEMQRNLDSVEQVGYGAQRDLGALMAERNGYIQGWHADAAQKLAEATAKLSDSREAFNKAQLRRQLVELRAERDATVLTISRVSIGSVLNAGQQFISLVPSNAPLEVEVNIPGSEDGYVHVGDAVALKFDTFPYTQYGMAHGVVRIVSADSFTAQDEQRNPTGAVPLPGTAGSGVWYRARVTLDRIDLHDTPAGFRLSPGMPVTADVMVGKRTVLAYFLGRAMPLLQEGMREP